MPLEDEVEVPDFGNDRRRFSCYPKSEFTCRIADDDEMISDDEVHQEIGQPFTWLWHTCPWILSYIT